MTRPGGREDAHLHAGEDTHPGCPEEGMVQAIEAPVKELCDNALQKAIWDIEFLGVSGARSHWRKLLKNATGNRDVAHDVERYARGRITLNQIRTDLLPSAVHEHLTFELLSATAAYIEDGHHPPRVPGVIRGLKGYLGFALLAER